LTRRRLLAACSLLLLGALVALGLGPAAAQESGPPTFIRAIDASDPENVELQLVYGGDDVADAQVVSDGTELATGEPSEYLSTPDSATIGLVVVVDTSAMMDSTGALNAARDGLSQLIAELPAGEAVAILAAGDEVTLVTGFSENRERLEGALASLGPSPEGGVELWAGIARAGQLLADRDDLQPNIMVITSGNNTGAGTQQGAIGQAVSSGSSVFVVGAQNAGFTPGPLEELVGEAGGSLNAYATAGDLAEGIATTGRWLTADQFIIPFEANRTTGVVPVTVNVGEASVEGAYVPGRFTQGAQGVAPAGDTGGGFSIPFLEGTTGKYVGIILAVLAIAGFAYAVFLLFGKDEGALSNVLQPYSEGLPDSEFDEIDDDEGSYAKGALMQRAVSVTEQMAESQGYLSRTEAALERANLPLRAGEALFFYLIGVIVVTILALLLFGSLVGGLVVGFIVALIPPATVNFLASRRRNAFLQLLPDTLQLLAGTLRAGYSLMQGVEAVSQEVSEPMGQELRRVVTESRLGRPLEESLDGVAERMASPDFAWAVMAIRIQREVGGNLSELLLTVAETMTQRERLRRDIKSLTAEGRISAIILGFLPLGLAFAMWAINPEYIGTLFNTTFGNVLLILALIGMLVGFAWMRQIIKIEI
jgi:tight adherence protein B